MEIVIALVIVAAVAYYLFSKHREMEAEQESVPYKVESPVVAEPPVVQAVVEPVVEVKPEQSVKAKTPRQRSPKQAQPAKKPAAIQPAAKARKPRAPKAK